MDKNLIDLTGEEYDAQLHRGLSISGENKFFFIAGRLRELQRMLPKNFNPRRILDFGCGAGDTTRLLAETFPHAEVRGLENAEKMLDHARRTHSSSRISFGTIREFNPAGEIDLCYVNGVFHHIQQTGRSTAANLIYQALAHGGYLAIFENNPWNPGTQWLMSRIPFDRGTRPVSSPSVRLLLDETGFTHCAPTRFLFYFPRPLAFLRFSEPWLARLPLGAQYFILATKK